MRKLHTLHKSQLLLGALERLWMTAKTRGPMAYLKTTNALYTTLLLPLLYHHHTIHWFKHSLAQRGVYTCLGVTLGPQKALGGGVLAVGNVLEAAVRRQRLNEEGAPRTLW